MVSSITAGTHAFICRPRGGVRVGRMPRLILQPQVLTGRAEACQVDTRQVLVERAAIAAIGGGGSAGRR